MGQVKKGFAWLTPKSKERFVFLVENHNVASLIYFRKQYGSLKRIDVDKTHRVLPTAEGLRFQVTDTNSKRITLEAASELQMRLWIQCLN
jgi:hypothetical protein